MSMTMPAKQKTILLTFYCLLVISNAQAGYVSDAMDAVEKLIPNTGKSKAVNPPNSYDNTWPAERRAADERFIDERGSSTGAPISTKFNHPTRIEKPETSSTPPKKVQGNATAQTATSICTDLRREWSRIALISQKSSSTAYTDYLKLLMSCSKEADQLGTADQAKNNLDIVDIKRLASEPIINDQRFKPAWYMLQTHIFYSLHENGDDAKALTLGRKLLDTAISRKDTVLITTLAWLEHNAGNTSTAERLFRSAYKIDPQSEIASIGLASTLLARRQADAAWAVAKNIHTKEGDRLLSAILSFQAGNALSEQNYKQAEKLANSALDYDPTNSDALVVVGQVRLQESDLDSASAAFNQAYILNDSNIAAIHGIIDIAKLRRDQVQLKSIVDTEPASDPYARLALADIYETEGKRLEAAQLTGAPVEWTSALQLGGGFRSKSGTEGQDRLRTYSLPILGLQVDTANTLWQFNLNNLQASNADQTSTAYVAHGAVKHTFENQTLKFSLDAIHLDQTYIGTSIEYKNSLGTEFWGIGFERHLVSDSLRSMGLESGSGIGPIIKTGVHFFTANHLLANFDLETDSQLGSYAGSGTQNNDYFENESTLMYKLSPRGQYLVAGPMVRLAANAYDENRFTNGYGGYFSPQNEVALGIKGRLSFKNKSNFILNAEGKSYYANRSTYKGQNLGFSSEANISSAYLAGDDLITWFKVKTLFSADYSEFSAYAGVSIPFNKRRKITSEDIPEFNPQ